MKTKKVSKKLVLTKSTISNLSSSEMNIERGGNPTDVCTLLPFPRCGCTLRDCAGTYPASEGGEGCVTDWCSILPLCD
jgi:hypothetical protein